MKQPSAIIIEHERGIAHVFEEALELVGLPTETFSNAESALARLSENVPALIILNLDVPNDTGIDLLQHIRDQVHLRNLPLVVITADSRQGKRLEGTVNLVLVKPITYAQLAKFAALIAAL